MMSHNWISVALSTPGADFPGGSAAVAEYAAGIVRGFQMRITRTVTRLAALSAVVRSPGNSLLLCRMT